MKTAMKKVLVALVVLAMLGLVGLIALVRIKQDRARTSAMEALSLEQLRERNEISARVIDPCHPDGHTNCPKSKFIAVVPKIKGIAAMLVLSQKDSENPLELREFRCTKTEFLGGNILASKAMETAPQPNATGTFYGTLIVKKDDQMTEVTIAEPIELK